ncbi:uncharacterized protein LOC128996235 [Macrosteles quadrilineatus]|uniref:uncharacterized protein LOC128996235 n=1 Tax=Macrosteles quadrilineatus TaxID=74068 RepID=UPI0023E2078D|nr:uncharacterized protein LOC128996235 [Macrosteles quadrilineatus]
MASTCTSVFALGVLATALLAATVYGQRITTIQLDGTQYFISRMNPYSPELNYFLAYQYCRSIGLQLASFETKEKADAIMQYLINAGYNKYDFWTSGNRLGTDMMIWMSTGLPFNATFDYMRHSEDDEYEVPMARQLSAVEPRKDNDTSDGCVLLRSPDMYWDKDDCTKIRDFICEQTRCYYYNYGSIPVSPAQGNRIKVTSPAAVSSTPSPPPPTTSSTPSPTFNPTSAEPNVDTQESEDNGEVQVEVEVDNEPAEATHNNDIVEADTTTEPVRSRSSQHRVSPDPADIPWTWARNIMLEKPVLKKSAQL